MARHVKLDAQGAYCPRCSSRQFQRRSMLAWGWAKSRCQGCGANLRPARRLTRLRHRRWFGLRRAKPSRG